MVGLSDGMSVIDSIDANVAPSRVNGGKVRYGEISGH